MQEAASRSPGPPTGTVTFLFTDIEDSTRLWDLHAEAVRAALIRHDALVEEIIQSFSGVVVRPRGEGDSRFAVFLKATGAIGAAGALQKAIYQEPWTTPEPLRIRIAMHTGEADLREGDYYGSAVNRCARLRSAAHGGQTLLTWVVTQSPSQPRSPLLPLCNSRSLCRHVCRHVCRHGGKSVHKAKPPGGLFALSCKAVR